MDTRTTAQGVAEGDIVSTEDLCPGLTLFGRVYRILGTSALVRFSATMERWVGTWQLTVEQAA